MQKFLLMPFEPIFLVARTMSFDDFMTMSVILFIICGGVGYIYGLILKKRDKDKIDKIKQKDKNDSMSIGQINSNQIIRNKDESMKNNADNFSSNICPACGMDLEKKVPGHSTTAVKFDEDSKK